MSLQHGILALDHESRKSGVSEAEIATPGIGGGGLTEETQKDTLRHIMTPRERMKAVTIRMPESIADRVEALIPAVGRDPNIVALGGSSLATVLRLVVARGVEVLEGEFGGKGTQR